MNSEEMRNTKSGRKWILGLKRKNGCALRTLELYFDSLQQFLDFHGISDPDTLTNEWKSTYDWNERQRPNGQYVEMMEDFEEHLDELTKDILEYHKEILEGLALMTHH